MPPTNVAILGAGVIGQILAVRLAAGGLVPKLIVRHSPAQGAERIIRIRIRSRGRIEQAAIPLLVASDPAAATPSSSASAQARSKPRWIRLRRRGRERLSR